MEIYGWLFHDCFHEGSNSVSTAVFKPSTSSGHAVLRFPRGTVCHVLRRTCEVVHIAWSTSKWNILCHIHIPFSLGTWRCECSGTTLMWPATVPTVDKLSAVYSVAHASCSGSKLPLLDTTVDLACLRDYLRHLIVNHRTAFPKIWIPQAMGASKCRTMTVDGTVEEVKCDDVVWFLCWGSSCKC